MVRAWVFVLLAGGCATERASRVTVDATQIPTGQNCYRIGPWERAFYCVWRMQSGVANLLGTVLDEKLARAPDGPYQARFVLDDLHFTSTPAAPRTPVVRTATYRFSLADSTGRPVLEVNEQVIETAPLLGVRHPLAKRYLPTTDVFGAGPLYELMADVAMRIGDAVERGWPARN
jgi:hypothetical protein